MTDEHIIDWARKKFERTAKRIDIGVPFGDKAEDALWFVAPRLFAAVDERDALRKRVAELETSLHEARMLLPYEWRKEPE